MKRGIFQALADRLHPPANAFSESTVDTDAFRRLPFSERIKVLVRLAGEKDKRCRIFGAEKHRYRFHPTASMQEIRRFEEDFCISLPEAYVRFLTEVGNGGAGPDYGLYSLEQMRLWNDHLQYQLPLGETQMDASLTQEKWNTFVKALNAEEDDAAQDTLIGKMFHGALVISTQGCTYDTVLMCSGSHEGSIFYIDWNLEEESFPHIIDQTFEEWMEAYFLKIIQGDVIITDTGLRFVKH